ncbi:MAG: hypothetical protein JST85_00200 [Acidobacteria bacterium]|nr:hypothetical protein [Acidobacteriota bacterium]
MLTLPRQLFHCPFFSLAFWLVSLSYFAAAQQLPLKSYTTADGLAHNGVNRIVKDSRGFLWFCTEEGLSRFDGYTFTNYGVEQGLPHPVVRILWKHNPENFGFRRMEGAWCISIRKAGR